MITLDVLQDVQAASGAVIAVCCVIAFAYMSKHTRECFRAIYFIFGVAGLAYACLPLAPAHLGLRPWLNTAVLLALAAYLALDRRRISRTKGH